MKKKLIIGLTISAAVFGGFAIAQSMTPGSAASQEAKSTKFITEQEAKDIALKEVNGTIIEADYDGDEKRPHYEFEIQSNQEEVDVEVDAETGKVTITDREAIRADSVKETAQKEAVQTTEKAPAASTATEQKEVVTKAETIQTTEKAPAASAATKQKEVITKAEAITIAESVAKGKVVKVELDNDDDHQTQKYELEFKDGNVEYDVEINAYTGKIIEVDQELED
ncbi:PepSY domain-containing protein [Pradoshia sp.]